MMYGKEGQHSQGICDVKEEKKVREGKRMMREKDSTPRRPVRKEIKENRGKGVECVECKKGGEEKESQHP